MWLRIIVLFFLSQLSFADDALSQINSRLTKALITQGEFEQQKHLKVLRKPLVSQGNFTYHQRKGVIWQTLNPVTSILLVNESHLITAQGEQLIPATFGSVFQAMLGGDLSKLQDSFIITAKQGDSWQLQLQPKDAMLQKIIQSIELSGDNEIRALVIQESNGNRSDIHFSHIEHPQQLNPEQVAHFERLSH
jgi:outer membrane lipoprotein-sorting protein